MSSLCTSPQIRAWQLPDERHIARCLACDWSATPSTHKPLVTQQADGHRKQARQTGTRTA